MNMLTVLILAGIATGMTVLAQLETDHIPTTKGDVTITFIGHGSVMFELDGQVIHVDPYGRLADYAKLPKADLILVTHDHADHLDAAAIRQIRTTNTAVVLPAYCAARIGGAKAIQADETRTERGIGIEAIPAYNLVNKRPDGQPFHPKGAGVGYILTFGDKRVYVAGDTENTAEMKALTDIDVAFLPMNLPYTMSPEMVADAARAFKPKILYPYHFGDTDPARLRVLLKDLQEVEVRLRKMK